MFPAGTKNIFFTSDGQIHVPTVKLDGFYISGGFSGSKNGKVMENVATVPKTRKYVHVSVYDNEFTCWCSRVRKPKATQ
jgi:hypothetical protein